MSNWQAQLELLQWVACQCGLSSHPSTHEWQLTTTSSREPRELGPHVLFNQQYRWRVQHWTSFKESCEGTSPQGSALSLLPGCRMVFGAPFPGLLLTYHSGLRKFDQRRIFPSTLVSRREGSDLEGEGLYLPAERSKDRSFTAPSSLYPQLRSLGQI